MTYKKLIISLFCCVLGLASCNNDSDLGGYPELREYYSESENLTRATMDSICNFCDKLCVFVNKNPKSIHDEYFEPTMQNVRAAAAQYGRYIQIKEVSLTITIDTVWAGEHYMTF